MNGQLYPWEDKVFAKEPAWRNFFEHTPLVQFDHRNLALTTLAAVSGYWAWARRLPGLPASTHRALNLVMGMAWAQVALGVTTLLSHVPVGLGTAHQAGALALLSLVIGLMHNTRDAGRPFWAGLLQNHSLSVVMGGFALGAMALRMREDNARTEMYLAEQRRQRAAQAVAAQQ